MRSAFIHFSLCLPFNKIHVGAALTINIAHFRATKHVFVISVPLNILQKGHFKVNEFQVKESLSNRSSFNFTWSKNSISGNISVQITELVHGFRMTNETVFEVRGIHFENHEKSLSLFLKRLKPEYVSLQYP